MSSEIQKFYVMAWNDPAIVDGLMDITDPQAYAKKAVELGAANGCQFTEDEVAVWAKEKVAALASNELDDQQLEAVAGGKSANKFLSSFAIH